MRAVFVLVLSLFVGCSSLNSPPTQNASTNEMQKCCGCPGMEQCNTNKDDPMCCKPDDCKCKQITSR